MNRPFLDRFRPVCAIAAVGVLTAACSGSSTTPTPPTPPTPPPALQMTCPVDQTTQSATGQSIPVQYPTATTTGGTPPTQVACSPESGAVFAVGTTHVACTATDSKAVTASCAFNVTLTVPPKISVTRFVAFGDSMTAGEVVSEGAVGRILPASIERPTVVDSAKSYPTQLRTKLTARYTGQAGAIVVANAGSPGEVTTAGVQRLPTVIDGGAYDVLLLMEGVNDFPDYQKALGNMRTMVQYGKRRSVRVYLATVPPEDQFNTTCTPNRARNQASVDPYNTGLRNLAAAENVTLVDVFTAFNGDTKTLIDCDGLHPTPAGYQVIADTFFTAIQQTLEVPATTTLVPSAFRTVPVRRSR